MVVKISELPSITTLAATDEFEVVDDDVNTSKKVTLQNLWDSIVNQILVDNIIPWTAVSKINATLTSIETHNATELEVTQTNILLGRETAGSGNVEEINCTAFARTLLDDETAEDARTTLGINLGINEAQTGWFPINDFGDILYEYYIITSDTFYVVPDWLVSTSYTGKVKNLINDIVKPTSEAAWIYYAEDDGTSGLTEPTWPTSWGTGVADNTLTWKPFKPNVIETTVDLTAIIGPGMAIKYKYVGIATIYYSLIVGISATRIAIAGPGLDPTQALDYLYFSYNKVIIKDVSVLGAYCDTGTGRYLDRFTWLNSKAYFVHMTAYNRVNNLVTDYEMKTFIKINNVNPINLDTNFNGVYVAGTTEGLTTERNNFSFIDPSSYIINFNDIVRFELTYTEVNEDAKDLLISTIFILE